MIIVYLCETSEDVVTLSEEHQAYLWADKEECIALLPNEIIANFVLDYMLKGNQNAIVPREDYDVDLHYAGTRTVPLCWQFWHTYRIEDLVSNILMANQEQIFNVEWQRKINSSITDTGNALYWLKG